MTDYHKAIILNSIAVLSIFIGVAVALVAGILFLPWWPAKAACVIGLIWYAFRTIAAYYATR